MHTSQEQWHKNEELDKKKEEQTFKYRQLLKVSVKQTCKGHGNGSHVN